jgi:hypothetical protein
LVAATVVVGVGSLVGVSRIADERPVTYLVASGLTWLAVAGIASLLALRTHGANDTERRLRHVALLTPVLLFGGAALAGLLAPQTLTWPASELAGHVMCLTMYVVLSSLLLGLSALWFKQTDPWTPRVRGAAAGAAAGAWASFTLALRCPKADPVHVLATHVLPIVAIVLLGAWLGARRFGFKYRS